MTEEVSPLPLVTRAQSQPKPRKFLYCGKPRNFSRDCRLKNLARVQHENKAGPKGFKLRETGYIAKICPKKSGSGDTGVDQISTAMVTVSNASSMMSRINDKSTKWMLDSCCSRHMSNNRAYLSDVLECEKIVQAGNSETIPSYGVDNVRMAAVVDGTKHNITLTNTIYTPKIMQNLIFIAQARKRNFRARIYDDPENATVGRLELYHKPSGKAKMCSLETANRLYQSVAQVHANEDHVCRNERVGVGHERLGT